MLNDIKTPPITPGVTAPPVTASKLAEDVHIDPREPGAHPARIFGEKTHIDPEYATPLEDRGSTFSIGLTVAALIIVVVVLVSVYTLIR